MILAFIFFLPRLAIKNFSFKAIWHQFKKEFELSRKDPLKLASAIGLGLFFGVFPIWGFQMAVAFAIASALRLNRIIVLLSANISLPPLIPFILYLSFLFGGLFVEQSGEPIPDLETINFESIQQHLLQYYLGAIMLAILLGVIGFSVSLFFAKLFKK